MPHLLSIYAALEPEYLNQTNTKISKTQRWELSDLTRTDYGTVNVNGIYNVDDRCEISFRNDSRSVSFTANWRSLNKDDIAIRFYIGNNIRQVSLGLCPEDAYERMIAAAIANLNNDDSYFWEHHFEQDRWIHGMIDESKTA
jgi:hypothetical protein